MPTEEGQTEGILDGCGWRWRKKRGRCASPTHLGPNGENSNRELSTVIITKHEAKGAFTLDFASDAHINYEGYCLEEKNGK